jgi:hypothetical protein
MPAWLVASPMTSARIRSRKLMCRAARTQYRWADSRIYPGGVIVPDTLR